MLTKQFISELKRAGNGGVADFVRGQSNAARINFVLENLGRIGDDFESDFLFGFLNHPHKKVRLNAVKNIGKLKNGESFAPLKKLFAKEQDTAVRREIVSSLGRQRNAKNIAFLTVVLDDEDPKIVCQAIRGLLVFDSNAAVKTHLQKLTEHPNEMVREIIQAEYSARPSYADKLAHPQSPDFMKNVVVNGDVLAALKCVPDQSVHLTFTSPPYYNARDYSLYKSYEIYLDFLEKVFLATWRITKEGRFLIVNTSPIIIPRVSRSHSSKRYGIPFDLHPRLVKNGWEFIDDIVWLKPESSVKNRIGGFMQTRKPLAYKPNATTEYLMVYRKKTPRLLDWNIRAYPAKTTAESKVGDDYESSNVWKIDPCFNKVHSAVFPAELCKRVVRYYSYKGDLVFDPFAGSGTFGRTAKGLGRFFFLAEQSRVYFDYMKSKASDKRILGETETRFLTLKQFEKIADDKTSELNCHVLRAKENRGKESATISDETLSS